MIRREHDEGGMRSWAQFSDDLTHRFELHRQWDAELFQEPRPGLLQFIGLNPSTADEKTNDPTVTRCIARARALGFTHFCMTNLFPLRSTDPAGLKGRTAEHAQSNDEALLRVAEDASMILCAWGNHKQAKLAWKERVAMLRDAGHGEKLHCLKLNEDGSPAHPLYLPYTLQPIPFTQ